MPPTGIASPPKTRHPSLFGSLESVTGHRYIGIDPGVEGALASISPLSTPGAKNVDMIKMPVTEGDKWDWFTVGRTAAEFAVIEQQVPRPAMVFDPITKKFVPRILKSTCILYGNYMQLKGMLPAARIPFEDCPPKRWQKALKIRLKEKGEDKTSWKNHLKSVAQQLFPNIKVTLWNADALLISEYAKRSREGTL